VLQEPIIKYLKLVDGIITIYHHFIYYSPIPWLGKKKQFLKDWEKYERGEAGIPKLLKNKSEQDIANVLLLMFLVFTMPLSIILVAVYYYYSDANKKNFHAWIGTLTRRKDNY